MKRKKKEEREEKEKREGRRKRKEGKLRKGEREERRQEERKSEAHLKASAASVEGTLGTPIRASQLGFFQKAAVLSFGKLLTAWAGEESHPRHTPRQPLPEPGPVPLLSCLQTWGLTAPSCPASTPSPSSSVEGNTLHG